MVTKRGQFRHKGRVISIDVTSGEIAVSMSCATACDGCHAKGACPSSRGEERIVKLKREDWEEYSIGEEVELAVSYRIGAVATFFAYLFPLLLFVLTIIFTILLGVEQGVAALVGFCLTALYYFGLYLFRGALERVVEIDVYRI